MIQCLMCKFFCTKRPRIEIFSPIRSQESPRKNSIIISIYDGCASSLLTVRDQHIDYCETVVVVNGFDKREICVRRSSG